MVQQEQEPQSQRKGPPPGWRYPVQAKHRSRLRGWLAQVWRNIKNNAALVSAFVALFGILVTSSVTTWTQQVQILRQQAMEDQRTQAAARLAEHQAQQESLQTYLGDMGELLLRDTDPLHAASPGSEVSTLARAKTVTVLAGLDSQGKSVLIQFLVEARLIQGFEGENPIITLRYADLSYADLSGADLHNADLSDAQGVNKEQIEQQAASLKGAIMPDGSKHP
jgi:hypothetical protein